MRRRVDLIHRIPFHSAREALHLRVVMLGFHESELESQESERVIELRERLSDRRRGKMI